MPISELTTTNNNHRWLQTISYGHHHRSPFFISSIRCRPSFRSLQCEHGLDPTVWNSSLSSQESDRAYWFGFCLAWSGQLYGKEFLIWETTLSLQFYLEASSIYEWAFLQENLSWWHGPIMKGGFHGRMVSQLDSMAFRTWSSLSYNKWEEWEAGSHNKKSSSLSPTLSHLKCFNAFLIVS